MIDVVYLMGYGRSGSTLLDIVFSNEHSFLCVGELQNFLAYLIDGEIENHVFKDQEVLQFWNKNIALFRQIYTKNEINSLINYEKNSVIFSKNIISCKLKNNNELKLAYINYLECLILNLIKSSKKSIIFDTSKNPRRLTYYKHCSNINTTSIFLVKNVLSVANSLKKPWTRNTSKGIPFDLPSIPAYITGFKWLITNCMCYSILSNSKKWIYIEYEDFVNNYTSILNILSKNSTLNELKNISNNQLFKNNAYSFAGNRLRLTKKLTISNSTNSSLLLNRREIFICNTIQRIWNGLKPKSNIWQ